VYGPESHMTAIVAVALGKRKIMPAIKRTSSSFVCQPLHLNHHDEILCVVEFW